jgi:hypothetical protein
MIGLKSFMREFSALTNGELSPDALFERHKELVRCGLLPTRPGRGPGSGVPLTPETLATFLIGLLVTDSLTDLGERTAQLSAARPVRRGRSKRTDTFHAAVAKALTGEIGEYLGIQVTRHWRGVVLENPGADDPDSVRSVEYLVSEEQRLASPMISRTVSIEGKLFWTLCQRLRQDMDFSRNLDTYAEAVKGMKLGVTQKLKAAKGRRD